MNTFATTTKKTACNEDYNQQLSDDFDIDIQGKLRELYMDISQKYARKESKQYEVKKDTLLPYELNNKKDFIRHLLVNGPYPLTLQGKDVKITYSQFTKGFYITNSNSIIIGEPLHCEYNHNINDCIIEWKASNKIFIRDEKTFQA